MTTTIEIERKFLVHVDELPDLGPSFAIEQAYLSEEPCVRIRTLTREGVTIARLTVKGPGLIERTEIEIDIETKKAQLILSEGLWNYALTKNRYRLGPWEVDEFTSAEHEGFWLAEIELKRKQDRFDLPAWLGPEVSEDPRFTNLALARDGVPADYWTWVETGVFDVVAGR